MIKGILFYTGCILLIAFEILKVYFIMPFPGSQESNTIDLAYFIHNNIFWIRLVLMAIISIPFYQIITKAKLKQKVLPIMLLIFYAVIFYLFNFRFLADRMFLLPQQVIFSNSGTNKIPLKSLVVGVEFNGESKAFPIEVIAYHHQVQDKIGGVPVLVTYCSVCRTARVYSPVINGKAEHFRLVGMDHFNAMFEDATTKTWWRQSTGEAIAGELKGEALRELPSHQMTLSAWLQLHDQSLIMQPDKNFANKYDELKGFGDGSLKSSLEGRDTASWQKKSWIVGIVHNGLARAYDWNDLQKLKIINDTLNGDSITLVLNSDKESFVFFSSGIDSMNKSITFFVSIIDSKNFIITDRQTNSIWNVEGVCIQGELKGTKLKPLQGYLEFWHSWKTFHPNTTVYK